MRIRAALLGAAVMVVMGIGLTACGGPGADPVPTGSTTPTESAPTASPEAATEVVEIAPFGEDGAVVDGWTLDESTLSGDYTVRADDCRPSEHGSGENTVACGSAAEALSACWLTERSDQIACLDEASPEATAVRLIQLDQAAPPTTAANANPEPLWLELEDGSRFVAVNGGAFSPPEGYLVGYKGLGGGERIDVLLAPADESAPVIDRSEDVWKVTLGADGEGAESISTEKVTRAWVLAGRTLPEPVEDEGQVSGPETANGRWCEAPGSVSSLGCVTIAYPEYTIESTGETWPFTGVSEDGESFTLNTVDAPFGTYYPAGTPIPPESLMGAQDLPDQDRLWSGQSGMMLVRE